METARLNLAWGTNELPELKPYWEKWLSKAKEKDIFSPSGFFGREELKQAISQRFKDRYNREVDPDQVTVTNGGTEALYTIFQWVKAQNGRVIIQQPCWGYFIDALHLLGVPVHYSTATEPELLQKELEEDAGAGPVLFLLTQPSNPFGRTFSASYLQVLSDWVNKDDRHFVLSDEIYDWFVTNEDEFHSWSEFHGLHNSFIVHGYSKPTGLAAWRVGYFIAAEHLMRSLNAFHKNTTYGTATISQYMALEAQNEESEIRRLLQHAVQKRRKILDEKWDKDREANLLNDGPGMYAFITLPWNRERQERFFHKLQKEGEVMITPGYDFGIESGGMRINLCRSIAQLEESIDVLQHYLTEG